MESKTRGPMSHWSWIVSSIYVSKNLTKNIKNVCKSSEICIKNKTRRQDKYGLMSQLGPATRPLEIISIDTIGGFGGSRSTKHLHLLVGHFTRYKFIITSKAQGAHDFIKLINKDTDTQRLNSPQRPVPWNKFQRIQGVSKCQANNNDIYSRECAFFKWHK